MSGTQKKRIFAISTDHRNPVEVSSGEIVVDNQSQFLTPFQRKLLLKQMQTELRPEYRRRIEIMLLADDGQSQAEICVTLGCSQETARHWIGMARAGKAHQWDDSPIGRPQTINDQYVDRLKELVNRSPRDYGYPFKRWTAQVLSKHLANELGIDISNRHINRLLKKMGLSTRSSDIDVVAKLPGTKNFGIAIRDLQDLQPASSLVSLLPINPVQMSH